MMIKCLVEAIATRNGYADAVCEKTKKQELNGVTVTGYMLRLVPDQVVAPVMYPVGDENPYELATNLFNVSLKALKETDNNVLSLITGTFDPSRVMIVLVNKEMNPSLGDMPSREISDLLVTYRYKVGDGTVKINQNIAKLFDVTEKDLFKAGLDNLEKDSTIVNMNEYMLSIFGVLPPAEPGAPELWIVTNNEKIFGAATILSKKVQEQLLEKLGGPVVVLPSSIHEVLCVSLGNSGSNVEQLKEIVRAVNGTDCLQPHEKLSDNIYILDQSGIHMIAD